MPPAPSPGCDPPWLPPRLFQFSKSMVLDVYSDYVNNFTNAMSIFPRVPQGGCGAVWGSSQQSPAVAGARRLLRRRGTVHRFSGPGTSLLSSGASPVPREMSPCSPPLRG